MQGEPVNAACLEDKSRRVKRYSRDGLLWPEAESSIACAGKLPFILSRLSLPPLFTSARFLSLKPTSNHSFPS